MVVLLEEDQAERKSLRKLGTQTDTLSFSEGSLQLNTKLPFLCGTQSKMFFFFLNNFVFYPFCSSLIGFTRIIATVV